MSLNDIINFDNAVFANPEEFGESVTITIAASGQQYEIDTVVYRNAVSPVANAGKPASPAPSLQVYIPYSTDQTKGIPSRPIASADVVALNNQTVGGTSSETTDHPIVKILSEDAGGWLCELR